MAGIKKKIDNGNKAIKKSDMAEKLRFDDHEDKFNFENAAVCQKFTMRSYRSPPNSTAIDAKSFLPGTAKLITDS